MKKTILITGCAGFIGSNFVSKFKQDFPETEIIGIDDFSGGRRDAIGKNINFYEGSVTDDALLEKVFRSHKPDYVFHFAALPRVSYGVEHPFETTVVNLAGTVALLEKSRNHKIKRFIYSSSSAVYGLAKKLPTGEKGEMPKPISPYGLQKHACEQFCKMFSDLYHLDTVSLRYFNVFGPGDFGNSAYSTVIAAWLEGLYFPQNKKVFLDGDGRQSRDFCYVDNVIDANILAMQYAGKFGGEAFNVGSGVRINLLAVKDLIEKYSARELILEHRPARLGDALHTEADISKIKERLGYAPQTDFEIGLQKTIEWFKNRK